jgi:hypothetical protein
MLNVRFKSGLLIALSGVALSACFEVDTEATTIDATNDGIAQVVPSDPSQGTNSQPSVASQPDAAPPSTSTSPPGTSTANADPTIWGTASTQVMVGERYEFQPSALDSDGDALRFQAGGLPAWAKIDSLSGLVSGTPRDADAGETADIEVSVTDGRNHGVLPKFRIVVKAAPAPGAGPAPAPAPAPANNSRPLIGGAPGTNVQAQSTYSFRPNASDPEGQNLTFSVTNKPSWAAFSTATGALTAMLPAFTIVVAPAPNAAPTINGSPTGGLELNTAYSFRPTASDPDGDDLTFTISGKPVWAAFDASTGSLSGTPISGQAGTYSNIVIRVSDGRVTTSLAAFSIVVNQPTLGSATLSWTAPTQNTDGSSISGLSGYRIYYGTSAGSLGSMVQVSNPGASTYVVDNLRSGTWYFAVSAYNASGAESDRSTVGSKAIP